MTSQPIGDAYDPLGEHFQDPYPLYARAREEKRVFFARRVGAYVLTRYDDVVRVLRDATSFSSANALRPLVQVPGEAPAAAGDLPPGLPRLDGPDHSRLRAPVAGHLSRARVDALRPLVVERAETLVKGFAAGGRAELMTQYADPLAAGALGDLAALSPDDLEVAVAGSASAPRVRVDRPGRERERAASDLRVLHQRLEGLVARRREDPGQDLVSAVAAALAPGEAAVAARSTLVAGLLTTAGLIGSAVRYLLVDRGQWELVCRRTDLIRGAVEEAARFDTPSHMFFRRVRCPVAVGGRDLSPGDEVLVVYAAANRDPDFCEDPERFDITRLRPWRHVAFGVGRHACVGAGFARMVAQVAVATLARRLPDLVLAARSPLAVSGVMPVRRPVALPAVWPWPGR